MTTNHTQRSHAVTRKKSAPRRIELTTALRVLEQDLSELRAAAQMCHLSHGPGTCELCDTLAKLARR